MKIEKDINRVKICVEKMNSKVNDQIKSSNIKSFNNLVEYILKKNKIVLEKSDLSKKLYIILLTFYLEKYSASLLHDFRIKELHKLINKPSDYLLKVLCMKANDIEQRILFDSLGIENNVHPKTKTIKTRSVELENLSKAIKNEDNFKKLFCTYWDYEVVKKGVETNVLDLVNNEFDI